MDAPGDPYARLAGLIAGSPHNLVSRGDRERVSDHVDECRSIASHLAVAAGERWLDLGTGGGLPGLVLALELPAVTWVLLDSVGKKIDAVGGFAQRLGLANVEVRRGRAEGLARDPLYRERFDGVIARAVAPLVVVAELGRGFLRPGGTLVAVKGRRHREEIDDAGGGLRTLRLIDVHSARVPDTVRETWLVTMTAYGHCPPAFPRREGVPQTRPLE